VRAFDRRELIRQGIQSHEKQGGRIAGTLKALKENGNPELTFEIPEEANYVLVMERSRK
jgi:hypothetical protein